MPKILVLQHDRLDTLLRLGGWLTEAGADYVVLRLDQGSEVPDDSSGYDAVISLGGEMNAWADDLAPWLPRTRRLLARCVADRTPTLGICLGAQLLAVACGGSVAVGLDGPEIGAYLAAKRDAAEQDLLFGPLPMTPDVMQYHYDVIDSLPPGAVLVMSATGYPNQAFRLGSTAWGIQFHIEPSAADVRAWAAAENRPPVGRLGTVLDEAAELMDVVWRQFTARFVGFAENSRAERIPGGLAGRRLPLAGHA